MPKWRQARNSRPAAWAIASLLPALWSFAPAAGAEEAQRLSYGRHLAGECTTCHRIDGVDNGIPSIVGWPIEDFITTLEFYRDGHRNNPVMVSVASSLSEAQMQALAAYFASLPKAAKKAPAAGKKAPR